MKQSSRALGRTDRETYNYVSDYITRCDSCEFYVKASLFNMYASCKQNNYIWMSPYGELIGCSDGKSINKQTKRMEKE